MEFLWLTFLVVCVANVLYISLMTLVQDIDPNIPTRHTTIKGTKNQKFLYIGDFWTMTYGYWFGVPLIVNAFVHLIIQDITYLWWGLSVAMVSALAFLKMCLGKNHKPDYGFPATGKISCAGILHLLYFGAGIGAFAIFTWGIFTGELPWSSPVTWVALAGVVFYAVCFVLEIRSGNFDPLEKIEGQKQKVQDQILDSIVWKG